MCHCNRRLLYCLKGYFSTPSSFCAEVIYGSPRRPLSARARSVGKCNSTNQHGVITEQSPGGPNGPRGPLWSQEGGLGQGTRVPAGAHRVRRGTGKCSTVPSPSQLSFQCCNLPQLLNAEKNVQFHLYLNLILECRGVQS